MVYATDVQNIIYSLQLSSYYGAFSYSFSEIIFLKGAQKPIIYSRRNYVVFTLADRVLSQVKDTGLPFVRTFFNKILSFDHRNVRIHNGRHTCRIGVLVYDH